MENKVKAWWEGWQHIIPVDDLIEHENKMTTSADYDTYPCRCNPKLDYDNKLVIHAALDRRECFEEKGKK
ncbi:MAG: hypothetical protein GY861_15535 [bacterium]|nr:hypothetical protein [bacterium]